MVNDITKAYRVRDGISFDGDIFIFTGNVKPPSEEIPDVPAGSLYLYVSDGEAGIYQRSAGGSWDDTNPEEPDAAIYPPHLRPIFNVTGVYTSHWLQNSEDGYYFTLHKSAAIEFFNISGSIYAVGSNSRLVGVDSEPGSGSNSQATDNFPALYNLAPGYYRIQVGRWGTLSIRLHSHAGAKIENWPALQWTEQQTHTNSIFTFHDGPADPWIV